MATVLVIGASRGIGFCFVQEYLAEGWTVFGTYRSESDRIKLRDEGAHTLRFDTRNEKDLSSLCWQLDGEALDVLILNAGVYGPRDSNLLHAPTDSEFDLVMGTNVLAPMRLISVVTPLLEKQSGTLAILSSRMGSITESTQSYGMLYRVSKAAENMIARLAHIELNRLGIRVISLHPGWVRTDMGGPNAEVDPKDSVAGMKKVISNSETNPSGGFYDYRGKKIPW